MIVGVSTLGYSLVKPSIANYYKKQEIVYYSPLINNDVLPNNRNKLIDLLKFKNSNLIDQTYLINVMNKEILFNHLEELKKIKVKDEDVLSAMFYSIMLMGNLNYTEKEFIQLNKDFKLLYTKIKKDNPKSVLLKEIQNYKELIQTFENIEMQTTKKEDFILLMQKDKKNYKEIDLILTYNSMMKMQNNIAHWLNYCQKNKKNCNP